MDFQKLEHKLASLLLYMQTILHITKRATQEILDGFSDIVSFTRLSAKELIKDILKRCDNIDDALAEELPQQIIEAIRNTDPLHASTAEKGSLSTEHRRITDYKKHFQVIDPVEYLYDRLHKNSFVYVSVQRVLEVLLNREDVVERCVFIEDDCTSRHVTRLCYWFLLCPVNSPCFVHLCLIVCPALIVLTCPSLSVVCIQSRYSCFSLRFRHYMLRGSFFVNS